MHDDGSASTSDIVSRVTEFTTILQRGFFARTASTISLRLPEEPPMNTLVGAGRSASASGAFPLIISTLGVPNFLLF